MKNLLKPIKSNIFQLFKRTTTSAAFIPEIDGLRFLAIFLVVVAHVQSLYLLRSSDQIPASWFQNYLWNLLNDGYAGVLLFFTISGFILMLPFARYHLLNKDKVSLRKYYLRRITRLEPPYLLAMIFLFLMKLLIQKQSFTELSPHLGATLLYSHMAIYHEMSRITPITWSLEIEIQFYLLAPFLASVYRLSKPARRSILVTTIIILPFLQYLLNLSKFTFLGSLQYFLVGFLLVDLYLSREKTADREGIARFTGSILFLFLIILQPDTLWKAYLYPLWVFAFYYLVLNTKFWKEVFQNKFLTSVGGMCYSIYLLHFSIISFVGMKGFSLRVSGYYSLNILAQFLICLPIVLLISSVYYLVVEKPCMDPAWPQKIRKRILG